MLLLPGRLLPVLGFLLLFAGEASADAPPPPELSFKRPFQLQGAAPPKAASSPQSGPSPLADIGATPSVSLEPVLGAPLAPASTAAPAPPVPPPALEFRVTGGTVTAREGSLVRWVNVHDHTGRMTALQGPGRIVGPLQTASMVYYTVGGFLLRVDATTGVVQRRLPLPGAPRRINLHQDKVILEVAASELTSNPWVERYTFRPGGEQIPFFLSNQARLALAPRLAASGVLLGVLSEDVRKRFPTEPFGWRQQPAFHPSLIKARAALTDLMARDPTNLWYPFWRGAYATELGLQAEAIVDFKRALSGPPELDFELLPMSLYLDEVAPSLAPIAFDRGLAFLLRHGYEPELMAALVGVVVHYGRPLRPLEAGRDLDHLTMLGERMSRLAPRSEGVAYFFSALAEAWRQKGNAEQAARWDALTQKSMPFRSVGISTHSMALTGHSLTLLQACLLALLLTLVIKTLKYVEPFFNGPRDGLGRFNPLSAWTAGEKAGWLLVVLLGAACMHISARGVVALGAAAAAPTDALSGTFGGPGVRHYWEKAGDAPAVRFMLALSHQAAGDAAKAQEQYQTLYADPTSPPDLKARASLNLGVLADARGDKALSVQLFERARQEDPSLREIGANLGEAGYDRLELRRRYGLSPKLVALPTPDHYQAAWLAVARSQGSDPLAIPNLLRWMGGGWGSSPQAFALFGLGLLLMAGAVLARRPEVDEQAPTRVSKLFHAVGMLFPGTARQYGLWGPLLTTLFLMSVMVASYLEDSSGQASNILEGITQPDYTHIFGASRVEGMSGGAAVVLLARLWPVLLGLNLLVSGLLERRRPDPHGFFARTR